ncbi:MAG: hypothetical protein AB7O38_26930, partial [Pirellulaceae bacterium]
MNWTERALSIVRAVREVVRWIELSDGSANQSHVACAAHWIRQAAANDLSVKSLECVPAELLRSWSVDAAGLARCGTIVAPSGHEAAFLLNSVLADIQRFSVEQSGHELMTYARIAIRSVYQIDWRGLETLEATILFESRLARLESVTPTWDQVSGNLAYKNQV